MNEEFHTAETVEKKESSVIPTHADLMGVLESIRRELNETKMSHQKEISEWIRWRTNIDAQVHNLSEAWGEHGRKVKETSDDLSEIKRATKRIETMLLRRLYRDAAEGRDAEQDLRDLS